MLASVDMKNAKYATSFQALEPRLQAIVDLEDIVVELLRAFVDKTVKKPERILFYRDRVLQGQFVQVHRDEKDLADQSGICPPGTVVNTGIIHPFESGFHM
ncbi:hypothetical protein BKA57DRAFT_540484 [Linnemannia elongata]|nr:hypothetical protein BKA57DRAFT_540484 [Linnemannia elongata]